MKSRGGVDGMAISNGSSYSTQWPGSNLAWKKFQITLLFTEIVAYIVL